MCRIPSAEKNIIMDVPQKNYIFSATLGQNNIFVTISITIFNRPVVPEAVLQTPPSLLD